MDSCTSESDAKLLEFIGEHQEVSAKDSELTKAYRLCHKLQQSIDREQKLNSILEEENKFLKRERSNWSKLQEHNKSLQEKLEETETAYKDLTVKYEAQIQRYQDMLLEIENRNSHSNHSRIILNDLENRVSKLEFSDFTRTLGDTHKKNKTKLKPTRKSPSATKKLLRKRKISVDIDDKCSTCIRWKK